MYVRNVHQRDYDADKVGELEYVLSTLATSEDKLWARDRWPRMFFRGGKRVGASGGHGPVRYAIESIEPRRIWFRFAWPTGFHGGHGFTITVSEGKAVLRHVIEMNTAGSALVSWPMVFRPLHDALLEDSLDHADRYFGIPPRGAKRTAYVRLLRGIFQRLPKKSR